MKGNRAVLTAVVIVVVVVAGWWLFRRSTPAEAIHLIDRFGEAKKQPEDASLYAVVDGTLNGVTKKAIAVAPTPTRLTWRVLVPDDGWLSVSVGLKPEAWTQEGDGVLFFVGVSDNRGYYETLFTQHVHPFANSGDRKWIDVMVDLSAYAGEEVNVIFNTRSGPPPEKGDLRGDLALWGQPEIVQR